MSQALLFRGRCHRSTATVALRSLSGAVSASSSSAVDQMVDYAMGQRKANPDMAVDVLMSGLSYTSPQSDPLGSARLHLAIAQIEADRNGWSNAQAQAASSLRLATQSVAGSTAAAAAAADLTITSVGLATRALLVMGQDREAQSLAAACELALRATPPPAASASAATPVAGGSAAHVRSLGLLAVATHSAAGSAGPQVEALAAALGADPAAPTRSDRSLADAAHALGLLRALQGRAQEAEAALAAAADAAVAARAAGPAPSTAGWAREQHDCEVEADALAGRAQLQMRSREWGEAEELLGTALKAAEAAHGERSPSLAPLLTLLGYTYSRSARVTFAEGLYREAAKLLRLDPTRLQQQQQQAAPEQQQGQQEGQQPPQVGERQAAASPLLRVAAESGVHASSVAVLAWRYAQLLWVLPNRGREASRWEGCARQFWAASSDLAGRQIEAVLGGEGHLKGEGPEGSGVLFSTRFRRAWPGLSAP